MRIKIQRQARLALVLASALAASCSATSSSAPVAQPFAAQSGIKAALSTPAIVALNGFTEHLEAWPMMQRGGGRHPQRVSGALGTFQSSLAADGKVIAMATGQSNVLLYDLANGSTTTLPDPFGDSQDVAIDKNENIFVTDFAHPNDTVVMYSKGDRQHPRDLSGCGLIDIAYSIAADDEGDVFVADFASTGGIVVEFPNGPNGPDPNQCVSLDLESSHGFSGLAVDPKTDDLVTLDNPSQCAGGPEGQMVVYPKPYSKTTGKAHLIGRNCSFTLRLSADSTKVFVEDQDVSGSFNFILQRSFPDGGDEGVYGGGQPTGFTTVPNTLPN